VSPDAHDEEREDALDGPGSGSLVLELADGVRIEWDRERVAALADPSAEPVSDGLSRIVVEVDRGRYELLRVISSGFDDGTAIGIAALRPTGAAGHGEERVGAMIARGSSEPSRVEEALLSTEYDADGAVRRVGAELWLGSEPAPTRLVGDRIADAAGSGAERGPMTEISARYEGARGRAVYELRRFS
jgi:hypothetical protein